MGLDLDELVSLSRKVAEQPAASLSSRELRVERVFDFTIAPA